MWNKLSMKEKAALIKVAVSNGLTDLDLIKDKYNEYANGGPVNKYNLGGPTIGDRIDAFTEKYEPWAAGLALSGAGVGLATASTGYGIVPGAIYNYGANIPSTVIDAIQTGRGIYKLATGTEDASWGETLWNAGEFALGALGLKGAKAMAGAKADREIEELIKREINKALGKRGEVYKASLRKKGMSEEDIAKYVLEKAANTATNSKDVVDAKRRRKEGKEIEETAKRWDRYAGIGPNVIDVVNGIELPEIIVTPEGGFVPGYTYLNQSKALGGTLFNSFNPIESFNGGRRLPVVRYGKGGYLSIL